MNIQRKKIIQSSLVFFGILVVYMAGFISRELKIFPYSLIKNIYLSLPADDLQNTPEKYLEQQFTAPFVTHDSLLNEPIEDGQDLKEKIDEYIIDLSNFSEAYDQITIGSSIISQNKLEISFSYKEHRLSAYAYYIPAQIYQSSSTAIHVIPGSGKNQSSAIVYNEEDNYQKNIDDIAALYGDVFVLVKPNEDFLAIHNGKNKISDRSFVNYLLNKGSSYSGYYLIQSLAVSKYLDQQYDQLYVAGLSQGGTAALINALQSNPDKALIASGFSVYLDSPHQSGHNQIILPNIELSSQYVKEKISSLDTQFLFTWGKEEEGVYGLEANLQETAKFFSDVEQVTSVIHPKGHVYYEPIVKEFFE